MQEEPVGGHAVMVDLREDYQGLSFRCPRNNQVTLPIELHDVSVHVQYSYKNSLGPFWDIVTLSRPKLL